MGWASDQFWKDIGIEPNRLRLNLIKTPLYDKSWISIHEQLPEKNELVEAYRNDDIIVRARYYKESDLWMPEKSVNPIPYYYAVTHWRPISEKRIT